jgi:translocation and assembly module TamB
VRKRTAALLFLGITTALVLGTLAVLRTDWAGQRMCGEAAARVEAATGLRLTFRACRVDVFRLSFEAEGVALTSPGGDAAVTADALSARLAAVQALGRKIHLARLALVRPRVKLERPALGAVPPGARCPPDFLSRFEVQHLDVIDGAVDLAVGGRRLTAEAIDLHSAPTHPGFRVLARPVRHTRVEVSAARARLALPGGALDAGRVALSADVALDLSGAEVRRAEVELPGARVQVTGKVADLCAPRLDLTASAAGPIASLLGLAGVHAAAEGSAEVTAHLGGSPAAPELSGRVVARGVRVRDFVPGDLAADLRLVGDRLQVDRLVVAAQGGEIRARGWVRLARGLPANLEAELSGVDLAEILDRLGVTGPWLTLRLEGKGRLAGTLWPPQLSGDVDAALKGFKVLTRSFREGAGDAGVLAFDRGRAESKVRVDGRGLYFDGARVKVGRGTLQADAAIHFTMAGGFSVRASGLADLDATGRIAAVPWAGLATVEVALGAAPYGVPRIEGHGRVDGFRFLDVDLGSATAEVRYQHPILTVSAAEGTRGAARYRGDLAVDLLARPIRITSAAYELHGRVHDLCDAVMYRIPRAQKLREVLDAEADVTGTAHGPAQAADLDFEAQLGPGTFAARRFDAGRVAGRVRALEEIRFTRAELRRGPGVARAAGTWSFVAPFDWDLALELERLPLQDLGVAAGLSGSFTGAGALAGTPARPRLDLGGTAAGTTLRGVELGAVRLAARLDGEQLQLEAGAEGVELTAQASLAGRVPFHARARLELEDATRLVPGLAPAGLRLEAAGDLSVEGELEDWHGARAEVTLRRLQAAYAELRIEATAPARLTTVRGRWELAPLTIQGPNTALTVSGAWQPGGDLDLAASGAFDLRLLSGLVPTLRRSAGQLVVEARLSGPPDQPALVGSGKLVDGSFQLKGGTASLTGVSGAVAFSQNRVVFDRLDATLNGGRARLRGEVELARLRPVRVRAEALLDEVVVVVPSLPSVTLSGRLEAEGSPESSTVTGRLHVVRARYTSDVDLQGSLLKRRPPPPPRAYDRAGEWLRLDVRLAVDGDVRVENDLVRGPLSGELVLTGTLAAPGLVGSLAMGRGSRASFRGNEFDLTHAVLDFTHRSRVEVALDVNGESQVRDYQVFLHVFGPLAQPSVKLTSVPDLPEQDIVTLLSLGFTRRDAGAQAGVGGVATATAAQALLSASGLDEQVKRFLPRGGPVRDLSMRIVTGYSQETGQVEPRAEFESWLLRDRLRLRYQTPLGTGKGRTAQAEVKLGEHTSLQYQWDNDNIDVPTGDHGLDLKLHWEWTDER